jgi:pSer/pThr/pTyr-binding forkhead associated (FHA) protein
LVKGNGTAWTLSEPAIVLGSRESADIQLPDPAVSPVHAVLRRDSDGWWLSDADSGSGTFLNDIAVTSERRLSPGDRIRLGAVELQYQEGDEATAKGPENDYVDPRGKGWTGFADGEPVEPNDALSRRPAKSIEAKPGHILGEVRGFQSRTETELDRPRIVWTFRLQRYDSAGNSLRPVSVQIKGFEFHGSISDGDLVEVEGDATAGTLAVEELFNHTTDSRVTVDDKSTNLLGCLAVIVVFVLIAVLIGIYLNARFERDIRERQGTSEQRRSAVESRFASEPTSLEIELLSHARSSRPSTDSGDLITAAHRRWDG